MYRPAPKLRHTTLSYEDPSHPGMKMVNSRTSTGTCQSSSARPVAAACGVTRFPVRAGKHVASRASRYVPG
jgi:hypothetical protein